MPPKVGPRAPSTLSVAATQASFPCIGCKKRVNWPSYTIETLNTLVVCIKFVEAAPRRGGLDPEEIEDDKVEALQREAQGAMKALRPNPFAFSSWVGPASARHILNEQLDAQRRF